MSSPDAPMGDRYIAGLIGNTDTETGLAVRDLIELFAGTGVGTPSTRLVLVVTGTEVRPNATTVFWLGGATQPVNMGADDTWFAPTPATPTPDTTAPSVPTGLASSEVTQTGFKLTWNAATDNIAVTGYDIHLNGVFKTSTTGTTATLTGLTAGTNYSVTVRSKDAASNASAASSALSVTTSAAASGTAQHSIWGDTAYPFAVTKNTDDPITVANSFYSYGTSPDVSAWRVVGMKLWVPAGVTLTGPLDCKAWLGDVGLGTVPSATGTLTSPVAGQWNEVFFDAPIETNSGDKVWCGYHSTAGEYLGVAPGTEWNDYVVAVDGSHIVLSEIALGRGRYRYDSGAAGENHVVFGIDVIYDEGV